MPAMTVATGCGCIELRTSSFIIGYIDLVLCIIGSTMMFLAVMGGAVIAVEGSKMDNQEELRMAEVITVICAITLVYVMLMLGFTITLLVGLHKNKRTPVKVYLVAAFIFFFVDFVMFFVGFVHSNTTSSVVIRTIILILEAYSLIVIRSYYYKMGDSDKNNARYTTA